MLSERPIITRRSSPTERGLTHCWHYLPLICLAFRPFFECLAGSPPVPKSLDVREPFYPSRFPVLSRYTLPRIPIRLKSALPHLLVFRPPRKVSCLSCRATHRATDTPEPFIALVVQFAVRHIVVSDKVPNIIFRPINQRGGNQPIVPHVVRYFSPL